MPSVKSVVRAIGIVLAGLAVVVHAQPRPNLVDNLDRPLRYRPDGADFVIENGAEFFKPAARRRNTRSARWRDKRSSCLPAGPRRQPAVRAGSASAVKWLHDAPPSSRATGPASADTNFVIRCLAPRARCGSSRGAHQTEALIVRVETERLAPDVDSRGLRRRQRQRAAARRYRHRKRPDRRMVPTAAGVLSRQLDRTPHADSRCAPAWRRSRASCRTARGWPSPTRRTGAMPRPAGERRQPRQNAGVVGQ